MLENKTIGIIGFGNMGSSIAQCLKEKYQVFTFDKDRNKTNNLSDIKVTDNILDLVKKVDILILAIKPQDFDGVLLEIKNFIKDKLLISIAAGITTKYIEEYLGKVRVIRAMPNIGAKISESVTCLSRGRFATGKDLVLAQALFDYLGVTKNMEEQMINPSTAISGSGPAYIFDYIESNSIDPSNIPDDVKNNFVKRLAEAAKEIGFNPEEAMFLAVQTTNTSINLLKKTGLKPSELRRQVTSKGGTTEAALEVLKSGGSWEEAAVAATKRAEELAKCSNISPARGL